MKKKKKANKGKKGSVKAEKQSVGRILSNTWFMLKIVFKVSPRIVIARIITNTLSPIISFLTGTLMLREIINNFQNGESARNTILMIVVIYLIRAVYFIINYFYNRFFDAVDVQKIERHLNGQIYAKIAEMDLSCYENTQFYDQLVRVAADAVGRVNEVFMSVMRVIYIILSFSMNAFLILTIDPLLTVFAVVPLISTFFLSRWDNKRMFEYNMEIAALHRQRDYTRRTYYLQEYAKEMRLSNIGEVMFARFRSCVDIITDYMKGTLPLHAFINLLMSEIQYCLCTYGAMFYSVFRTMVSGSMMMGDCIIVIHSVQNLTYMMSNIAKQVTNFQTHSLYVNNLRQFLEYVPTIRDGEENAPEGGAALELKDVRFRYEGQEEDVIRGVNITVKPGEKIALVGHNGAGKTTLAKLMLRLYDPTGGTIEYGDADIRTYKLQGEGGYRERFAVVFQDFKLFAMSVSDNILLRAKREGDDALVAAAIESSGFDGKLQTLPQKEDTLLTREFDDKGVVLSGGEGQKLVIARAFAKDADVVILDEPSSALDPIAEYKMYENMMKACENKSVVFISHRLSSATLADTIYLLENGQVIERGSHAELMARSGKYAEMFRIQAQNYMEETEDAQ